MSWRLRYGELHVFWSGPAAKDGLALEHRREFGTGADAPADADVARWDVGLLVDLEVSSG